MHALNPVIPCTIKPTGVCREREGFDLQHLTKKWPLLSTLMIDCAPAAVLYAYTHKTQTFENWMERSICRPRTQCIMSLSIRGGTGHPSASALLPSPCLARPKLLHVRTCWWLLLCCSSFYVGLWCLSGSPALEIICMHAHCILLFIETTNAENK